MKKKELIQFLQDNLDINIKINSEPYDNQYKIKVSITLEEETICSDVDWCDFKPLPDYP